MSRREREKSRYEGLNQFLVTNAAVKHLYARQDSERALFIFDGKTIVLYLQLVK